MLTIARALMSHPKLVMLDEPSLGLMPTLVKEVFEIIQEIHAEGTTILLVEQNARKALAIADYAYVLETGEIVLEGPAHELREMDQVRKAYLGER
jgi:branched-chain amino acid transport system ATP-binding protein